MAALCRSYQAGVNRAVRRVYRRRGRLPAHSIRLAKALSDRLGLPVPARGKPVSATTRDHVPAF